MTHCNHKYYDYGRGMGYRCSECGNDIDAESYRQLTEAKERIAKLEELIEMYRKDAITRDEAIAEIDADRNRLREALEEIANGPWGETLMRTTAIEALGGEK